MRCPRSLHLGDRGLKVRIVSPKITPENRLRMKDQRDSPMVYRSVRYLAQ